MTTVREFRANLKTYLERIRQGEVIEVGGIRLCVHDGGLGVEEYKKLADEYSHAIESVHVEEKPICDKCKKSGECRKMFEEGVEYVICIVCALKARLNWNKLEKL